MDSDELSHARRLSGDQGAVQQDILLLGGAVKVRKVDQVEHLHLLHATMKDYLKANRQELHFDCQKIHVKVARACLTYLRSDGLKEGPLKSTTKAGCGNDYQKLLATLPFPDYAARHWSYHLRDARLSNSDICKQVYESHATAPHRELSFQVHQFSVRQEYVEGMSCLHVLAYHDLDFLEQDHFRELIERCIQAPGSGQKAINATDANGRTALWLAAEKDRKAMAKILLDCDAGPNMKERNSGMFPLVVADQSGRVGIVEILLKYRQVERRPNDGSGRNALCWAASLGHVDMVTQLLQDEEMKSAIDFPDSHHGQTPLIWAARKGSDGRAEVVDILLKDGADPNAKDRKEGRSALSWAARNEEEGMVIAAFRLAGCPDEGKTPTKIAMGILDKLSVSSSSRWAEVSTSLLIEAGKIGDVAQLNILLQRRDIDPNSRDADGWTALSWSARSGHGEFVKRLLDDERVHVNLEDNLGRTALMWAASEGRFEETQLLLKDPRVQVNLQDIKKRTALMWAALKGRIDETKLLLRCPDIEINTKDVQGKTADELADNKGHGPRIRASISDRRSRNPSI
ncbi:hypothetical protein LTR96_010901 [Exophiala xenobiotica]|nr:hypothetical protein LTR92_010739 [Exophiala xenobiotica]KAK5203285.1 hypothetical protein LTR41_011009 [Exophiala xenobiotica]KAK5215624.1 hypothetical protein LTR72_011338 [Exophiala xenobiotica]KAK5220243.1 hypothetical protein LTR47_011327 [Exophiala xenobiotica]KAK5244471.1 hypothetical protein LTS06_009955 [Exophiala xenobiotica]